MRIDGVTVREYYSGPVSPGAALARSGLGAAEGLASSSTGAAAFSNNSEASGTARNAAREVWTYDRRGQARTSPVTRTSFKVEA